MEPWSFLRRGLRGLSCRGTHAGMDGCIAAPNSMGRQQHNLPNLLVENQYFNGFQTIQWCRGIHIALPTNSAFTEGSTFVVRGDHLEQFVCVCVFQTDGLIGDVYGSKVAL